MNDPNDVKESLPLSYESPVPRPHPLGGAIAVMIVGLMLVMLASAAGLLAISMSRWQAKSEAVVGLTFGAGAIGAVGLYLIVAAARKLLS